MPADFVVVVAVALLSVAFVVSAFVVVCSAIVVIVVVPAVLGVVGAFATGTKSRVTDVAASVGCVMVALAALCSARGAR